MMREPVETPPVPALTELAVDLDGLRDFVTSLDAEVATNLRPYAAGIIRDQGEHDGWTQTSGSRPLWSSRQLYRECLSQAVVSLRRAIAESEVLVGVATTMLGRYGETDALSARRLTELRAVLDAAGAAANMELARDEAERQATRIRNAEAQTRREDHGRGPASGDPRVSG